MLCALGVLKWLPIGSLASYPQNYPQYWGMSKDVAGLRWSLKKQKTRQAVSLAGFFELSWSSRWCRRGDWARTKQSMQ